MDRTAEGGINGWWGRFWNDTALPWLSEAYVRSYVLPAGFFVLTFLVYWYLGPQETIFDNHVSQANSILHGHLDLVPEYSGFITEPSLYDGRMYLQHGLGPALLLLPLVAIWGLDTNQTLVSVLLASASAPLVYWIVRTQVKDVVAQIWLVVLFMFGTIFWYIGANGGVWFLSHTATMFFMLVAVWATVGPRRPMLAAAAVGAAFLCRSTVAVTFPFFLIMFSDLWWKPDEGQALLRRIDPAPIVRMAAGAAPFVAFALIVNYLRFDNPLEGGYSHGEQVHQEHLQWLYNHGVFHISYVVRHPPVIFEQMPLFLGEAPYIRPSHAGLAIWATTPAFLIALFARVEDRRVIAAGVIGLALMAVLLLTRAMAGGWGFGWGWGDVDFPYGFHLVPIWAMIGVAIVTGLRLKDKLIIACWSAILPTMFAIFLFAATGWTQFGYRYAMDVYPFLLLLVAYAIGSNLNRNHKVLIGASFLVNLWGIVWIYQFEDAGFLDLTWVSF